MSDLILNWEENEPVIVNEHLHLTEYSLVKSWPNASYVSYARPDDIFNSSFGTKSQHGKFCKKILYKCLPMSIFQLSKFSCFIL